jgi:glycosyltransferase involved in cell wall biosynthesis
MSFQLTIITINYNNATGLQKTINSVVNQTRGDFEYIVIDGGSTDDSVDIVNRYAVYRIPSNNNECKAFIPYSWRSSPERIEGGFLSEPDMGNYHAMNKGIRLARGKYLHFLNSGDWLADNNVVKNMLNEITSASSNDANSELDPDILVGNVISVRPDGKVRYNRNNKEVSFFTFYLGTLQHTSAYIRKALFDQYGLYDETLKIVADWKWYLIVAGLNKTNVQFTDTYVTCFDTTGISSTQLELDKSERRKVIEELLPSPVLADYDNYYFDILQVQRMKKYPLLYRVFWFIERCLFKLEKWKIV